MRLADLPPAPGTRGWQQCNQAHPYPLLGCAGCRCMSRHATRCRSTTRASTTGPRWVPRRRSARRCVALTSVHARRWACKAGADAALGPPCSQSPRREGTCLLAAPLFWATGGLDPLHGVAVCAPGACPAAPAPVTAPHPPPPQGSFGGAPRQRSSSSSNGGQRLPTPPGQARQPGSTAGLGSMVMASDGSSVPQDVSWAG
jgi:hypothetical protein